MRRTIAGTDAPVALPRRGIGQQLEQDCTQGIDVGRNRDLLAAQLLRRRKIGRQHRLRRFGDGKVILQQLGDAEIEQLDRPFSVDHDVRRLEIAMHHEVGVRISHRGANIAEQCEPRCKVGAFGPDPAIDRLSVDIIHDHVRPSVGGDPAVDQPRNIRMVEAGKQTALAREKLGAVGCIGPQQFDRNLFA